MMMIFVVGYGLCIQGVFYLDEDDLFFGIKVSS